MATYKWDAAPHRANTSCPNCFRSSSTSILRCRPPARCIPGRKRLKQLSQGKVHLALASTHEFDKDCEFFKLYEDRIVLIAPLNHPWAKTGAPDLEDLLDARVILREENSGTYSVVKQGLENVGMRIEELQPVLTLSNAEAIALAVQEGLGIGFVSEVVVSRLVAGKSRDDPHQRVARSSPSGYLHRAQYAAADPQSRKKPSGILLHRQQPD